MTSTTTTNHTSVASGSIPTTKSPLSMQQQQQLNLITQTIIVNGQPQQIVVPNLSANSSTTESTPLTNTAPTVSAPQTTMFGASAGQASAPPHPHALLLPNGQIVPVVTQPNLLFPAATPNVAGGLLGAPSASPGLASGPGSLLMARPNQVLQAEATGLDNGI